MLEPKLADAVMSLRNEPNVVDIRTVGLTAGIDLASRPGPARQARLRRAQQRLPRQRPDDAGGRRHAGADAALDRHRRPDRRNHREGRQGDPRGGVASSFPDLAPQSGVAEHVRTARGARASAEHFETCIHVHPRQGNRVAAVEERWICWRHRAACCAPALALKLNQVKQATRSYLRDRDRSGHRHRHLLCRRRRAVRRRRHFSDRGASGRRHRAVSLD